MAEEQPATKKDTVVFLTEEEASVPSKVQGSNPAASVVDPDLHQLQNPHPGPHQGDADPQH